MTKHTYIINIKELIGILPPETRVLTGADLNKVEKLENAWLKISNGLIDDFGLMESFSMDSTNGANVVDASNRLLMPSFVDSHTHIVFAGTREDEYEMRLNGMTYEEIAAKGGGILNSARKLANTSEDDLFDSAKRRLDEVIKLGTGAIEIKSGYGLSVESETKMLRVIKRLKAASQATIKATFLGAHAVPENYKGKADEYLNYLIDEALPQIAEHNLADYVDIFCESGYFSSAQTQTLLEAAKPLGLEAKIHVNQFNSIGGIQVGVEQKAVSVDHLEVMSEEDFATLKDSSTIATLLPLCSFFIHIPYSPARRLINENVPIALATDYNPGSTPCGNMQLVQSMACVNMKMTPVEAFNASTINAAAAINEAENLGSITKGKKANLILTKEIPSLGFISYNFGHNHIEKVFLGGQEQ